MRLAFDYEQHSFGSLVRDAVEHDHYMFADVLFKSLRVSWLVGFSASYASDEVLV